MERKGPLHRLKPISNAFVVNGNCLACSDGSQRIHKDKIEEEKHERMQKEKEVKAKVSQ